MILLLSTEFSNFCLDFVKVETNFFKNLELLVNSKTSYSRYSWIL